MKINTYHQHNDGSLTDCMIWFCKGCDKFHVRAGKVLLSFTRAEFATFSDKVVDCLIENQPVIDVTAFEAKETLNYRLDKIVSGELLN